MTEYLLIGMARRKTVADETLLQIARDVFVRDGAAGSTTEIAARAGISEATLFAAMALVACVHSIAQFELVEVHKGGMSQAAVRNPVGRPVDGA